MSQRRRGDAPGAFLHVYQRGIAKRPVFETRADARYFLSLLAREVRRGTIRVVAFAILTTHFHLLIQSVRGEASDAMRRVLNCYVRWFNRRRGRDGALFRGRFGSRRVRAEADRARVLRYIDLNAPSARLAHDAESYPYASAFHYVAARRPKWLATEWVDSCMGRPARDARGPAYRTTFGRPLRPSERFLVEGRAARDEVSALTAPDLLEMAPDVVLAWMRHKCRLADGTRLGHAAADPDTVEKWLPSWPALSIPTGHADSPKQRRIARESLRVGALWTCARLTQHEIASRTGLTAMQVRMRLARFRDQMRSSQ